LSNHGCSYSSRAPTTGCLELLPFAARVLQQNAWATRTHASLRSEAKAWHQYCELANINPFPTDGFQLTLYATWLILSGRLKSADSVRQYVSAVSSLHREIGLSCPTPSQFGPLTQVIQGFRRLAQRPKKKSLPITPPILLNLLLAKPSHPLFGAASQTIQIFTHFSLILYLSMLRSANLVPASRTDIDWDAILLWKNVRIIQGGVVLNITKSKVNQFSGRVHQIPLAASADARLCPVACLTSLAEMYGPTSCLPDSPVFRVPSGRGLTGGPAATPAGPAVDPASPGWIPMIKGDYLPYFKSRLGGMGLNPALYSMHGMRHGSIQQLLLVEANGALCRVTSDHSSDAIMAYSTVPPSARLHIAAKVGRSIEDLCGDR
jgi:hypothetical protein